VPSPEIVVVAELTTDSAFTEISLAADVMHAYGNAGIVFDSAQGRFVFPGYGCTVTMVSTLPGASPQGVATRLAAPFAFGSDATAHFKRYRITGLVSDVTTHGACMSLGFPIE
jgi:hypothetical protein